MHSRKAQPEHRPDPFVQHKAGSLVCTGMLPYVQANPASLLNAACYMADMRRHQSSSLVHAIVLEDAHADTNTVLAAGGPVELLHATITNEGRVQGAEVITCRAGRSSNVRSWQSAAVLQVQRAAGFRTQETSSSTSHATYKHMFEHTKGCLGPWQQRSLQRGRLHTWAGDR